MATGREPVKTIAIVGGGLAGAITALTLLRGRHAREYDVTIYERAAQPYTTLCGEGLSQQTLEFFDAFDSTPYIAEEFVGAAWYWPGGVRVDVDDRCYTMARERWIPAMVEAARKAGAQYHANTKVTEAQVRSLASAFDLVIGADGPGSVVRKVVGGAHETMLGIQYRVPRDAYETDRLEFYTDKRFSPEYAWIFPRGNQHNVGLLTDASVSSEENWRRLDAFMEDRGVRGRVLKREAYPIGFFGTRLQNGNVVLVGDAAGLTNPVTKGGMAAVIYAADILADCLASGNVTAYESRIFSHPLTDKSFRPALEVMHRWTNADFESVTRHAPPIIRVHGTASTKRRYLLPLLHIFARNPWAIRDLLTLSRAMGVSRRYSW